MMKGYKDEWIQKRIREMFDVMLKDDEKGKEQDANGIYHSRKVNDIPVNSQEYFYEQAYENSLMDIYHVV